MSVGWVTSWRKCNNSFLSLFDQLPFSLANPLYHQTHSYGEFPLRLFPKCFLSYSNTLRIFIFFGKSLFEMCWFYMGKRGKKVPQTILASLYTPPLSYNAYMETTHFKKGLPLCTHYFAIKNYQQVSTTCPFYCLTSG